jgi:hypothetical protein
MKSQTLLLASLLSLCTAGLAQSPTDKTAPSPQSPAQQSFDQLKTLAGHWTGNVNMSGANAPDDKPVPLDVTLRVTSMGNTLMHEMKSAAPDDPITMFTLDGDKLVLTHYCDAGNQPHMVATVSPDGKTYTFDFVSAANLLPTQHGHMQHVVFTLIDPDHHTEKWEFAMADGKTMGGVLDLHRAK